MFARPDLAKHIRIDFPGRNSGHGARSRGYKEKVTDNPQINSERRNMALMGTTDGVPYFEDQRRGAWPFILRCVNLPDGVSMNQANTHLHLISANEYFEVDTGSDILRRRIRGPKSLQPHMNIIVDDLLGFYHKGTICCLWLTLCIQ
jgi:hypothetical protein